MNKSVKTYLIFLFLYVWLYACLYASMYVWINMVICVYFILCVKHFVTVCFKKCYTNEVLLFRSMYRLWHMHHTIMNVVRRVITRTEGATRHWTLSAVKTTLICHSCQDIVISRTIMPLCLCHVGEKDRMRGVECKRGEWAQTVGLVCCCVLLCLGFQRPDDYSLIPGDSFLA